MTDIDTSPESEDLEDVIGYVMFTTPRGDRMEVKTYGMFSYDLPELMLEDVSPAFLTSSAADLVNEVADYMISRERAVCLGDTLLLGPSTIVRVAERPNDDEGHPTWALEHVPDVFCPECEGADHELWVPAWVEALARGESLNDLPVSS